ncbi:hypothetical protein GCM10027517_09410 [Phycicoccus ginsengisoli]
MSGRPFDQDARRGYVELVESLVRHLRRVAHRTGPGGQCVDAAVGDYSLSRPSVCRAVAGSCTAPPAPLATG